MKRARFVRRCWQVSISIPYIRAHFRTLEPVPSSRQVFVPIVVDDRRLVDRELDAGRAAKLAESAAAEWLRRLEERLPPLAERTAGSVQRLMEAVRLTEPPSPPAIAPRDCAKCGDVYKDKLLSVRFCVACRAEREQQTRERRDLNLPTTLSGAIGELRASLALMTLGYYVFRSLTPMCPCDLVAMRREEMLPLRVEVKHYATCISADAVTFDRYEDHFKQTAYDILAVVGPRAVRLLFADRTERRVAVSDDGSAMAVST